MSTILSIPLANQLQVAFIDVRTVYEIRERYSRMYHWTALVTSQLLIELPWNILGSSLYFLCWYWTVGLPNDRAGYTYLLYSVLFPLYYSTFGQVSPVLLVSYSKSELKHVHRQWLPCLQMRILLPCSSHSWHPSLSRCGLRNASY